eukprot:TRINITY_DN2945_c0_g1_i2.p1 TRINITY_DN2945_c0_g1~~TRINITY_DN2945_c0_g1_i2.p1  ORF type:complete len:448 (+),score=91.00 TRINITY_DN2945_c0_g1_i2:100-1443(+)
MRRSKRLNTTGSKQELDDLTPTSQRGSGKPMDGILSCPTNLLDLAGVEDLPYRRSYSKTVGGLRPVCSAPGFHAFAKQHAPQALPQRELGLEGCEALRKPALASISSLVDVAVWGADTSCEESGASGGAAEPVLQVGEWVFRGDMTMLYDGSQSLSNSTVKMGPATSLGPNGLREDGEPLLVAVKTVSLEGDAESVAMLRREIEILRELGDGHPHVLPLLYCAELSKELVLLTRFAPEGDLHGLMPRNSPVAEVEVRRLALQLLSALGYLHGKSIIHGDMKPQNVFLSEVDDAMLACVSDFGLSVKVPEGDQFVTLKGVQGSYGFIPAEVIQSGKLGFAADLFALGVMIFRYLGGYDPFHPPSRVTDPLEFDESTWGLAAPTARDFAVRLLSTDPAARGRAEELLATDAWLLAERGDAEASSGSQVRFLGLDAARAAWLQTRRKPTG